jgi:hypothetical protein
MPSFKLPLSGDVAQVINPWSWAFNAPAGQIGLFNIAVDLGQSSAPEVERAVLGVASYGKQLGRIGDMLDVLVARLRTDPSLSEDERIVLSDYETMRREIAAARAGVTPGA